MIEEINIVPISQTQLGFKLPALPGHPVSESTNVWWADHDISSILWQSFCSIPGYIYTISACKGGFPTSQGEGIARHRPVKYRYHWNRDQSLYGQSPFTALALSLDGDIHNPGYLTGNGFPENSVRHITAHGQVDSDYPTGVVYHTSEVRTASWGSTFIRLLEESTTSGISTPVVQLTKSLLMPTWTPSYTGVTMGFRFTLEEAVAAIQRSPSRYTVGNRTTVAISGCSSILYTGDSASFSYTSHRTTNNDSASRVIKADHTITVTLRWEPDTSFQQQPISTALAPQYYKGTLETKACETYYRSYYGTTIRVNSGLTSTKQTTFDWSNNIFTLWPQSDGTFVGGNLRRYWTSQGVDRAIGFSNAVNSDFANIVGLGPLAALDAVKEHMTVFEDVNIETLVEAREIMALTSPFTSIKRLAVDIARGRKGMTMGIAALESAGGIILATEFGILPAGAAVAEVADKLPRFEQLLKAIFQPSILRGFRSYDIPGGAYGYSNVRITVHAKVIVTPTIGSMIGTLTRTNALGILPTFSQLYQLLPWSFVVDWFLNLSERMESVETSMFSPVFNINGVVYGYTIEAFLGDEVLSPYDMTNVPGSLAKIRVYRREYSRLPPIVRSSKYDFAAADGPPQILGGALMCSSVVQFLV